VDQKEGDYRGAVAFFFCLRGWPFRTNEMARVTRPVIVLEIKLIQRTMALETSLVVQIVCNL
tara:strand:+ start:164 stop:349 length:186 start_codon:yes stop_codon:yes gene_type:complete